MDRYQTMAAGGNPDAGEDTGNAHKIGKVGAALLIIVSLILDILSIADTLAFEIPIADILATAMAVILLIYLIYKGIPSMRPMVRFLVMYFAEYIPIVDYLPLYLVGAILVIATDQSKIASTVVQYIPSKNMAGAKAAAAGERVAARMQKLEQVEKKAEQYKKKVGDLRQRLPGPLRSIPESGNRGAGDGYLPKKSKMKQAYEMARAGISESRNPDSKEAGNPFFAPYEELERDNLPELTDVIDVDVTGAKTTSRSQPPKPAG